MYSFPIWWIDQLEITDHRFSLSIWVFLCNEVLPLKQVEWPVIVSMLHYVTPRYIDMEFTSTEAPEKTSTENPTMPPGTVSTFSDAFQFPTNPERQIIKSRFGRPIIGTPLSRPLLWHYRRLGIQDLFGQFPAFLLQLPQRLGYHDRPCRPCLRNWRNLICRCCVENISVNWETIWGYFMASGDISM